MSDNFTESGGKTTLGCFCFGMVGLSIVVLFFFGLYIWGDRVSESTTFLVTDNMNLQETHVLSSWKYDAGLQADPKVGCYLEPVNKTAVDFYPVHSAPGEIVLKASDDFLVLVEMDRGILGINIDPKNKFSRNSGLEFYRILKETTPDGIQVVKTELLGSFETNLYDVWGHSKRISISPDGKYAVMDVYAAQSRSLGEYRGKEVLLIWEFGENIVEKEIVDRSGQKIPIIVKTEEEIEKELDEQYLREARENSNNHRPEHPDDFTAIPLDNTSAKLAWGRSRWADGYRIYQMSDTATHWMLLTTLEFEPREHVVTGLVPGKTYYFKVEAFNSITNRTPEHEHTTNVTLPP